VAPDIAGPAAPAIVTAPDLIPVDIMDAICGARAAARPAIGAAPGAIAATRHITVRCPAAAGADLNARRGRRRTGLAAQDPTNLISLLNVGERSFKRAGDPNSEISEATVPKSFGDEFR